MSRTLKFASIRFFDLIFFMAIVMHAVGCDDKSDSTSENAIENQDEIAQLTGFSILDERETDEFLSAQGWDSKAYPYNDYTFSFGFELTDSFPYSLDSDFSIDLKEYLSKKALSTLQETINEEKPSAIGVIGVEDAFKIDEAEFKAFRPVAFFSYDSNVVMNYHGASLANLVDESEQFSFKNENQNRKFYVFISKEKPLTIAAFQISVEDSNSAKEFARGVEIYNPNTPFMGRTDRSGKSWTVVPLGLDSVFYARKNDLNFEGLYGYKKTISIPSSKIGTLFQLDPVRMENSTQNAVDAGLPAGAVDENLDIGLDKVTVTRYHSVFSYPISSQPAVTPIDWGNLLVPEALEGDSLANQDLAVEKRELFYRGLPDGPQSGLSCNGVLHEDSRTFIEGFGTDVAGWRFLGDAGIRTELYAEVFENNDSDLTSSYCFISTSSSSYQFTKRTASQYQPLNLRVSEVWQKIKIPDQVKTMHARLQVSTQEYPQFIGNHIQDQFWLKFDENRQELISGTISQLAKFKAESDECSELYLSEDGSKLKNPEGNGKCGDIESTYLRFGVSASNPSINFFGSSQMELFEMTPGQTKIGACSDENTPCMTGYIPPRRLCIVLPEGVKGKTLTLVAGVGDGGDFRNSTSLAIDSIAFSNQECNEKFSNDDDLPRAVQK